MLTQATWTAIRQYIALEVQLGIAELRRQEGANLAGYQGLGATLDEINGLRLRASALETQIREALPEVHAEGDSR